MMLKEDVMNEELAGDLIDFQGINERAYLSHPGRLYRLQALPPVHGPRCNARAD